MAALKEAVSDDDYLNETLKVGNGSSGVKGFKRKAFSRAVSEYKEVEKPLMEPVLSPVQPPVSNTTTSMNEMNGNAFLPSNLFSGFDDLAPKLLSSKNHSSEPPQELVCPIGLVSSRCNIAIPCIENH